MERLAQYLIFMLDEQRYALPLSAVDKVVHRVGITPLINAPPIVSGVINVQGRVIPVFDMRRRFGLPARRGLLRDRMIIAHTARWTVALVVDAVLEVIECSRQDVVETESILPDADSVQGVAKWKDGLVLVHDLAQFLSLEEQKTLQSALKSG